MRLLLLLVLPFLSGCILTPEIEDRQRFDALNAEMKQLNQTLQEYKARIDELNVNLKRLYHVMGGR